MRSVDDKRLTESQVLEMLGLESIQSLIRKRKLQWVAHCARRGEEHLTWERMVREIEGEPIVGHAWVGVDPVVDSQEKAPMGGSLCEKGRRGSHVEEDGARG